MQKLQRPALVLILIVGLITAFWPVGEKVFGWWSQRALQISWQQAARAALQPKTASPAKAKAGEAHAAVTAQNRKWLPTRIVIPEIKLDAVVVCGVDKAALRQGPGHDETSVLPGQPGNCVIAAHRNMYGWWFYKLSWLSRGATIDLITPVETYRYQVEYCFTVDSNDTALLRAPVDKDAAPRLMLYTCTAPKTANRDMIIANLVAIKPT